jgi:hypothetical protein
MKCKVSKKGHAWVRNERGEVHCGGCGLPQRANGLDVARSQDPKFKDHQRHTKIMAEVRRRGA